MTNSDLVAQAREHPVLVATDVSKYYHQTIALAGVSLCLSVGETLAIMGPSGSGKSTLLHCLSGILLPDEGSVWFEGQSLERLDDNTRSTLRRQRMGMIFQFPVHVPELSVLDNVALPLILDGWSSRQARAIAQEWLARVSAYHLATRYPGQLSGGQQQLLAVARALVREPALILADEPTGSLDSRSGERVLQWLKWAATQLGSAVIIVTHDPSVGRSVSRQILMKDGKLL